ncbi:hypothetical protein [Deinococcus hopiensis]|uniref:Uncharacterized protein n=1 Tax=Deinococcus hopiensis KR-140 TaxID=695939 RepID=A0A1W1VMW0_9DEIO|nr:hypothetical protein [Deinococcus hopiensis]SMB94668.1 hypothetical protein SAMN00790413_02478 [Deinococcus hopiensis KR-140]
MIRPVIPPTHPASVCVQVILEAGAARQQAIFQAWVQGQGIDVQTLKGEGAGSGVHTYRLTLSPGPAVKIDLLLQAAGAEVTFLPDVAGPELSFGDLLLDGTGF